MIYVNARFVTQPLTGVQRYAFEICMQLKKMDTHIVFLCPPFVKQQDWALDLPVQKMGINQGHRWEQIDLPLYLSSKKKALLFSPCNMGPLFYKQQWLTLHDLSFKLYPQFNTTLFSRWYQFAIARLCYRVTHIFTVSETVKQAIAQQYKISESKISTTFNGIGASMLSDFQNNFQKEKIILTVGSLSNRKNTHLIIEAFLASDLLNDYTLVIIGKPNAIYQYKKSERNERIVYIEEASDSLLKTYYAKASIACFMSVYEGFGIPILEALYYQCKVICSDIPVFRELYDGAVYFCDVTAVRTLTKMLNEIPNKPMAQASTIEAMLKKYDYQVSADIIYKTMQAS